MLDLPLPSACPVNEPTLSYAPGSPERAALRAALAQVGSECPDIPHVIGRRAVHEGERFDVRARHAFRRVLARS